MKIQNVSIPQAVSTVATVLVVSSTSSSLSLKVSIPQAVSTVATKKEYASVIDGGKKFQYRKR